MAFMLESGMPQTTNITVTPDDAATRQAKDLVHLGIVRSFNQHYAVGRAVSNLGLIGAGYLLGGFTGVLVATGAELVNQAVRSTSFPPALTASRRAFIDRNWQKLSWSGFADKVRAAFNPAMRRAPPFPVTALPEPVRRDFRLTALELGLRHASIGPLYTQTRRLLRQAGPGPR